MRRDTWIAGASGVLAMVVGCAASPPAAAPIADPPATSPSPPVRPPAAASSPAPAPDTPPAPALPRSEGFAAQRILEADVVFLAAGAGDRLAILAAEGGAIVPHRFEAARWQRLPLPSSATSAVGAASLGMFFGRDHRPRLMGHREVEGARRMVYLRHKDGAWRDERGEIGSLAGDGSVLFGVLGDEDPEIVCRVGGICLRKSRAGWKELKNVLPERAVVRAFGGAGYALLAEGVLVARDEGFARLGPPAAWSTEATGLWVGADGEMVVVEPAADALHVLAPGATTWRTERSPIRAPRDVFGPRGDRWIAGAGGLAHEEGGRYARVGDASWSLLRVVPTSGGVVAAGPSGVVRARPTSPP